MNKLIKIALPLLGLASHHVFASQSCVSLDVDAFNAQLKSTLSQSGGTPLKLSGCFNIDKSVILELDSTKPANTFLNVDMSETVLQVNYTSTQPFPAVVIRGVNVNNDNKVIENSYLALPTIKNITPSIQRCHYLTSETNAGTEPYVPGVYPSNIATPQSSAASLTKKIGVKISGLRASTVSFSDVSGFCVGVDLTPDDTCSGAFGCSTDSVVAYNSFYNGRFTNNFTDILVHSIHASGWVNQNNFYNPEFASDEANNYCIEYVGSGGTALDSQCRDIMFDGKLGMAPPDNNSVFEPIFDAISSKADNLFVRKGNNIMVYRPSVLSGQKLRVNAGFPSEFNRLVINGTSTTENDDFCRGYNHQVQCASEETGSIKHIAIGELRSPALNLN